MNQSPLPWVVNGNSIESADDADGMSVAIASLYDDFDAVPEWEANAEYIVRACNAYPDLVAALEAIQKWIMDTNQLPDDGITHPLFIKANNLTVAALKKAGKV